MKPAVRDAALRWIADDVDAGDRAELQQILASALAGGAGVAAELVDRMTGPLRSAPLACGDGLRVMVRPSGTEPKLKAYLELIEPVHGARLDAAQAAAGRRLSALRHATLRRIRNP